MTEKEQEYLIDVKKLDKMFKEAVTELLDGDLKKKLVETEEVKDILETIKDRKTLEKYIALGIALARTLEIERASLNLQMNPLEHSEALSFILFRVINVFPPEVAAFLSGRIADRLLKEHPGLREKLCQRIREMMSRSTPSYVS